MTPYLFQAGTDAGAWRTRGVPVYGIYPSPITAEELTRMHGNDERVSIAALTQGTEMIFKTLVEVAGRPSVRTTVQFLPPPDFQQLAMRIKQMTVSE